VKLQIAHAATNEFAFGADLPAALFPASDNIKHGMLNKVSQKLWRQGSMCFYECTQARRPVVVSLDRAGVARRDKCL
jgi:hypothetical protein